MKIKHPTFGTCVLAVLCLSLTNGIRAADEYQNQKAPGYRGTGTTATPMKSNKATGLIGMQVRNQNDEKLGEIKDLVVDLQSGKISYAVLDAGGVLKDKLFAVPINAFTANADHSHLILNADKSKMETAQGFDKNAWPSVSNPTWGAEFWERHPGLDRTSPRTPSDLPSDRRDRLNPNRPTERPNERPADRPIDR